MGVKRPKWAPTTAWQVVRINSVGNLDGEDGDGTSEWGKPYWWINVTPGESKSEHVWFVKPRERAGFLQALPFKEGERVAFRLVDTGEAFKGNPVRNLEWRRQGEAAPSTKRDSNPAPVAAGDYAETESAFLAIRQRLLRLGVPDCDIQAATATMFIWWNNAGRPAIPGWADIERREEMRGEFDGGGADDDAPF
jgi:hypothetical protein